jgi:hypothetical protein
MYVVCTGTTGWRVEGLAMWDVRLFAFGECQVASNLTYVLRLPAFGECQVASNLTYVH